MKPILSFLLIFNLFFCFAGFGQIQKADSLQKLLTTAIDTGRVNLLLQLGIEYRLDNKDIALNYIEQSLEEAINIGFIKGEIEALYTLGLTYKMTSDYPKSLDYLKRCLALAWEQQDFITVNRVYNAMGNVYSNFGDYPTSQGYYHKYIRLIDSLGLQMDKSAPYVNLGVLYNLMGEQDKAIESYRKALVAAENEQENRELLQIAVQSNLAEIDFDNGNYRSALENWLKVSAYDIQKNNFFELCIVYFHIGNCYTELKEWGLASKYYNLSLKYSQQVSAQEQIASSYYGLADLMFRQKRFEEAINYSNKSLENLEMAGGYKQKLLTHQKAYEIYEANGQLNKAIEHLKQSMIYRDSLLNEAKIKEIQSLQVKHEVYIKDKELQENALQMALLDSNIEANNKRIIYLSLITALLLISAGLLFFGLRNKIQSNRELQEKTVLISEQKDLIGQMNQELEKRMLRAQMNPHFIFNSLNSIQYLINTDDKKNALKYLSKFAKLLRQVLESSININLSLKEEIQLLKIYVELESLRFDNSFKYTFAVDKNLDVEEYEVPMLLVQPYIENAIIHGLMPKEGGKKLKINFNDKKDYIECVIEDNGVGITQKSEGTIIQRPSRGMSITAQRIEMLKRFSDQELVNIENLEIGTRVTILIPKNH